MLLKRLNDYNLQLLYILQDINEFFGGLNNMKKSLVCAVFIFVMSILLTAVSNAQDNSVNLAEEKESFPQT